MRLSSIPSSSMIDYLNTTYFNAVWNSPDNQGRRNFAIYPLTTMLQIGSVTINHSVVGLPTTDTVFTVYSTSYSNFGRFIELPFYTWTTDTTLISNLNIDIAVYTSAGKLCPKGAINLYYDPIADSVTIAIPYLYIAACTGELVPALYVTIYKDTSRNTSVVSSLYTVSTLFGSTTPQGVVSNYIATAASQYPNKTIVVINGYIYSPEDIPVLNNNDVVNIISDPSIIGYCDITVDDSVTGYFSTLYGEYREVLHIEKSLNPNNIIITNDMIDVVVLDPVSKRGLYGLRIDDHAIMSITHNDFSMSRSILNSFQNNLASSSVVIRIFVRYPTKPLSLPYDANYISDLYTFPDAEIQKQLTGTSLNQLPAWQASNLEQSPLISLFYNFAGFDSTSILNTFIPSMGYYDLASVMSQAVVHYKYPLAQVEISKPVRLYGIQCNAIVYVNGLKQIDSSFVLTDYTSTSFLLGFEASANVPLNANITVYILEDNLKTPIMFKSTQASPSIILDNEDYALYQIYPYSNPTPVWAGFSPFGYELIEPNIVKYTITSNPDGTYTYTIADSLANNNFYLIPKYGMSTSQYFLDTLISEKKPLIISLQTTDNVSTVIPLIGYTTLEMYINGNRLVNNIDYQVTQVPGTNNDVAQTLLTISNINYLNLTGTGNILEVVNHGDAIISSDSGYCISNIMYRRTDPILWSTSCGRAFANGLLVNDVTNSGNILTTTDSVPDGSVFDIEWCIPYGVSKLLSNYSAAGDYTLKQKIDGLLGLQYPIYPNHVIITNMYALYSPYLSQIVYDVANGLQTIIDETQDDLFLNQFERYNILKNADPTLGTQNLLIDRRFVTLAADYINFTVTDPAQMLLVQRLISLVLTPTNLSINQVLI